MNATTYLPTGYCYGPGAAYALVLRLTGGKAL